jgi:hypothetical protein
MREFLETPLTREGISICNSRSCLEVKLGAARGSRKVAGEVYPQSLNLYDYVGGEPTNHADADGCICTSSRVNSVANDDAERSTQSVRRLRRSIHSRRKRASSDTSSDARTPDTLKGWQQFDDFLDEPQSVVQRWRLKECQLARSFNGPTPGECGPDGPSLVRLSCQREDRPLTLGFLLEAWRRGRQERRAPLQASPPLARQQRDLVFGTEVHRGSRPMMNCVFSQGAVFANPGFRTSQTGCPLMQERFSFSVTI